MVELRDFSKSYGRVQAVRGLSMECRAGEVTALLGPNGAGKTTVLKAVCARHFASRGAVLVEGVDAAADAERVRSLTGFVAEQPQFPPELTVREFLSRCAALHGIRGAARAEALSRVEAQCALGEVWGARLGALSKGFLTRVNFAQALVHNPPVLVLDEPASGLDPAQIIRMRALVLRLAEGRTVLLSTHLMQEVDALCARAYIIAHGTCAAHGTAADIARAAGRATLEEAFIALTAPRTAGTAGVGGENAAESTSAGAPPANPGVPENSVAGAVAEFSSGGADSAEPARGVR